MKANDVVLITKTGAAFNRLDIRDIIVCNLDGNPLEEGFLSKEILIHTAIYKTKSDINAIIHIHNPFGLLLGAYNRDKTNMLPLVHRTR